MLLNIYSSLKEKKIIQYINKFLTSNYSMISILLLTGLSNVFSLEFMALYGYLIIITLAVLFGEDMLSVMPITFCAYISFSRKNNPAGYDQTSIFLNRNTMIHFIILCVIIGILMITRFIYEMITKRKNLKKPQLLYGFAFLGLSFLLGGLFTKGYDLHDIFIGFLEIIGFSFVYFYFYFTVNWENVNKTYCIRLLMGFGIVMSFEVLGVIYHSGFLTNDGTFNRGLLYTGWGTYNNLGGMVVIALCAPFYYACTSKKGWIYLIVATLFALFIILTQSRNSILCGFIIYVLCLSIVIKKRTGKERLHIVLTFVSILLLCSIFLLINLDRIKELFYSLIQAGSDDSGRFEIYKTGLLQFKESFVFGKGFNECGSFQWGVHDENPIFPARYHNTYVQILASCGSVGMIAYLYHRYQTLKLYLKDITVEKIFLGVCIASLILISILDCHLFNIGPALIYGGVLLCTEKLPKEKEMVNC